MILWLLYATVLGALVLRHETEHLRAGDPLLLRCALGAAIAMPWNPALWWLVRRLHLAVETDCDTRVLRRDPGVERYGTLLLVVNQRAVHASPGMSAALSEPRSFLARRITTMSAPSPRHRLLQAAPLAALAAAVAAAACQLPQPTRPSNASPASEARPIVAESAGGPPRAYFEYQVEKPVTVAPGPLAPHVPDSLRAASVEGDVLAQFVVDTLGVPDSTTYKVLRSTHDLFMRAVKRALPGLRFTPAEVEGRRVRQLVQQSFTFSTR